MSDPYQQHYDRGKRSEADKKLVTALHKLLMDVSIDKLLAFLHAMRIQFTLHSDGKGQFRCHIFQHYKDLKGEVKTIIDYDSSGTSAHATLANAVTDFLASDDKDYHTFLSNGWPDL